MQYKLPPIVCYGISNSIVGLQMIKVNWSYLLDFQILFLFTLHRGMHASESIEKENLLVMGFLNT
jgi:hypothetical protein